MSRIDRLTDGFQAAATEDPAVPAEERDPATVDYLDPEQQQRILYPGKLGPFVLTFEEKDRAPVRIVVQTEFTPALIGRRGVLEDIDSTHRFILATLARYTPTGEPPSFEWLAENPALFGWASQLPDAIRMALPWIAKLSEVVDSEGKVTGRPTTTDVVDGLDSRTASTLIIAFLRISLDFRITQARNAAGNDAGAAAAP